ncbi:MAG TPA: hypothetical protein VKP78_11550 [bacterium]|nr:hypothetical protein [bacterium]
MKNYSKYHFFTFLIGTLSMFAQVVFMRLASTVFHGNELTYCIITGHWLLWTSLGSRLGSYLIGKFNVKKFLPLLSMFYVVALILFSYLIYLIRPILQISNSEILGLGKIFLIMAGFLAIPTLLNGMFFPVLVKFIKKLRPGTPVSGIYAAEVFGSAFGSLLFALLIFLNFSTFANIHIIAAVVISGIILIVLPNSKSRILTAVLIPVIIISIFYIKPRVTAQRWQPMTITEQYETPYQAVVETHYEGKKVVYGNGEVMPVFSNIEFAEEIVHFPMLAHQNPESILIIGLADSSIVAQLRKYKTIDSVTIINENRQLQTRLNRTINKSNIEFNYHSTDPVTDLESINRNFDVIILNISQPVNILWNRFYTSNFFNRARNILHPEGVFALNLPGDENYLSKEHIRFLKTIHTTLNQSFDKIEWIPGQTIHLIAGAPAQKMDYKSVADRLQERNIENMYITDYYLVDRLSPMKIDFLKNNLNSVHKTKINTLMTPVAFYFNTILWDQKSGGFLSVIYKNLNKVNGFIVVSALGIIVLVGLVLRRKPENFLIAEMTLVGFFHMVFENLLIIVFQSYIGALYLKIIFLFFAFMVGAGLGALYFHKYGRNKWRYLPFLVMVLLPVVLYLAINLNILLQILLPLILLISGLVDGYLFPYILDRFQAQQESSIAGRLYAADILGSCLGAYLFSAIILPIWGIEVSIFFIGIVGLVLLVGEFSR